MLLTEVQGHADEDDETKPGVKECDEEDDGDDDISDGWEDAEHYVAVGEKQKCDHAFMSLTIFTSQRCVSPEQAVDGRGAAVDAPQDVAGLAAQVPAQGEGVQVGKEAHLDHAVGELLHPDPQERAHVADEPGGAWRHKDTLRFFPPVTPQSTPTALRYPLALTCPSALQELEQDVSRHCSGHFGPASLFSQVIH